MKRLCWALITILAMPFSARATLVQQDLFRRGDGLVTLDTNTGLRWADLPLTMGFSVRDVQAGYLRLSGPPYPTLTLFEQGWRHATQAEFCGLLASYAPGDCNGFVDLAGVVEIQSFLGISPDTGIPGEVYWTLGVITANENPEEYLQGTFGGGRGLAQASSYFPWGDPDLRVSNYGHFLVRPVPEPSAAALLILVALGLVLRRAG